jgi:hypothetical protein
MAAQASAVAGVSTQVAVVPAPMHAVSPLSASAEQVAAGVDVKHASSESLLT